MQTRAACPQHTVWTAPLGGWAAQEEGGPCSVWAGKLHTPDTGQLVSGTR